MDTEQLEVREPRQRIYGPNQMGQWGCPGGFCSHYKCIENYESAFVGKRYHITDERERI